jgi:phosphodiesterase/alkaline phosphatase D-like protein
MKTIERRRSSVKMLSLAFLSMVLLAACNNDDDPKPLAAPVSNAATEIQTTSFKANWSQVTGAEKYLLDVSTNANFTTTLQGFNKKEITGATNAAVTGLTAATKYYYRVYAKKGSQVSAASAAKEVTTSQQ